jgi:hypothetical protein
LHATEAHHAEEVLDVVLLADDQATKVMQPGKEAFHSPDEAPARLENALHLPNAGKNTPLQGVRQSPVALHIRRKHFGNAFCSSIL